MRQKTVRFIPVAMFFNFGRALSLGKTSAEVFPAQLGPGYTEQDRRVLEQGFVLEDQLELHLYGSREPGWCLMHKRALYSRKGEIIGLVAVGQRNASGLSALGGR